MCGLAYGLSLIHIFLGNTDTENDCDPDGIYLYSKGERAAPDSLCAKDVPAGALIAVYVSTHVVAIIFGIVLIFSAAMSLRRHEEHSYGDGKPSVLAEKLKLNGSYPTPEGRVGYKVRNLSLIHI